MSQLKVILILFLFAGPAGAQNPVMRSVAAVRQSMSRDFNPQVILAKTPSWTAQRQTVDNQVRLDFLMTVAAKSPASSKASPSTVTYKPLVTSSLLLSSELQQIRGRHYLITVWQEGAHFTNLRIFDPLNEAGPLVWEKASIGDLKYELTEHGVRAKVFVPQAGHREPVVKYSSWRARP